MSLSEVNMSEKKECRYSGLPHAEAREVSRRITMVKYLAVCAVLLISVFGVSFSKSKTAQIKINVTLNNPPNAPKLLSPADNAGVTDKDLVFKWKFSDPDPGQEQKFFLLDIDSDKNFKSIDFTSGVMKSSRSRWKCKSDILEGKWYWRVRVSDGYTWSKFSKTGTFDIIKPVEK